MLSWIRAGTVRWPYVDPKLSTVYDAGQHRANVVCLMRLAREPAQQLPSQVEAVTHTQTD